MGTLRQNVRGTWYYVRRVPKAFAGFDTRTFVRMSTRIKVEDDPRGRRADRVISRLDLETESYWRGLAEGRSAEAEERYAAARGRARALGFDYQPAYELAFTGRPDEIGTRLDHLDKQGSLDEPTEVAAVLGGEPAPELSLDRLFSLYKKLQEPDLADMSPDQRRKWANPKKRALANLKKAVGDLPVPAITRDKALDFRQWWADRAVTEGVQLTSANKDFGHLSTMWRAVDEAHRFGLTLVFEKLRFAPRSNKNRPPFSNTFLVETLFADGALSNLNREARAVIYLMTETGLRVAEACNARFHLDGEVPYVSISGDGRKLKTPHSARDIPLVGVALAAAKAFPGGFEHYRPRPDSLSTLVNKYLELNKLKPTPDHSLYSLRHSFEDRLTALDPPDKIIACLMGHKFHRPRYGQGPTLPQLRSWVKRIELPIQAYL